MRIFAKAELNINLRDAIGLLFSSVRFGEEYNNGYHEIEQYEIQLKRHYV